MTTVGYGDYTATNKYEMALSILIVVTGPSWFAYTTGKAISVIHKLRDAGGEADNLGNLAIWLSNLESKHKRLPYKLKEKINKHYINYWKNDRLGSISNIVKETDAASEIKNIQDPYLRYLPDELKKEVLNYLFDDIFNNFSFFFGRRTLWRYSLSLYLQPRIYSSNEIIMYSNKSINELNFKITGKVTIGFVNQDFYELYTTSLPQIIGDYFVFNEIPSFLQCHAVTTTHCFSVPSFILKRLINPNDNHFKLYIKALESNYNEIKRRIEEKLDNIKENTDTIRKSLNPVTNHEISIPEIDIIKYDTSNGEKNCKA